MPLRLLLHVSTIPTAPAPGPAALKYARSNIMRAGVARADYYQPIVYATVGGTRRETKLHRQTLAIEQNLNEQPDTMSVECHGFTPLTGQEIVINLGAPDNRLFAGHILSVKSTLTMAHTPIYSLGCIDYTWELGHHRVRGRKFVRTPINLIFQSILGDFAPLFSLRGRPFGLAALDFQSNDEETVPEALSRAAKMVDADWFVDANRKVNLFTSPQEATLSFQNATRAMQFTYSEDMSQVRSRTTVRGGASATTVATAVSATALPIDDTRLFSATGGQALVGGNWISYTAKSVSEGAGSLTGIPATGDNSIRYDIAQGESVRVFEMSDDLGAQTRIASTLGSGHTGIIEHSIQDGNQGDDAARTTGAADLAQYATEVEKQLTFGTRDPRFTIGRQIQSNVTSPQTVSGSFQIFRISLSEFPIALTSVGGVNVNANLFPIRQIEAGINRRDLVSVLEPLA